MDIKQFPPSRELYLRVRAGFVIQDTSFGEWCRLNKIKDQNARLTLIGMWNGPKALTLREKIIKASGIANTPSE